MKIFFICAMPQGHCGVADYTLRLARSLTEGGTSAAVLSSPCEMADKPSFLIEKVRNWGFWGAFAAKKTVEAANPALTHFQYPAQGFGHKLGPQLLAVLLKMGGRKTALTLHEFKHAHPLRKLSVLPLLLCADFLFFTSEEERSAVGGAYPFLKGKLREKSAIVAVGCPLEVRGGMPKPPGLPVIAYFGLFYPGKLAEFALDAFCEVEKKAPGSFKYVFIGDKHPRHTAYFESVRGRANALLADRVQWHVGLSSSEVARELEEASFFMLPYAGGASFRRTTLNCALLCGAPVITNPGPSTPPDIKDGENVLLADTPVKAAEAALRLLADADLRARIAAGGARLGAAISWKNISAAHAAAYARVL